MNQDDKPTGKSPSTNILPPIQEATKNPKKKISGDLTAAFLLHSITQEKKLPQDLSLLNTILPEKKKETELSPQDNVLKPDSTSFDRISDIRSERQQRSARSSVMSTENEKSLRMSIASMDKDTTDLRTSGSYFTESARPSQRFGRRSQMSEQLLTKTKHALEDLDPPGIIRAVKDLERKVQHLKVENEVFYKFLQENDSEAIKEMAALQEKRRINADRLQVAVKKRASLRGSVVSTTYLGVAPSGPRGSIASLGRKSQSSVASISGRPKASLASFFDSDLYSDKEAPKIILAQKLDMVMKCMEEFEKHLETSRNHSKKAKRTLLSNLEEMEIRNEEIQYSRKHFEELRNTGPVTLEKFIRFFDEWLKKSRLTGDKIRLRHSSLKVQYHKTATLLANKKLIGEHVQEVDFDQLKVENRHLTEDIESKNCLLREMKKMTANGNLKLTQLKKILQEKMAKKETLLHSIKTFENDIMRSDEQLEKLYKELDQVKKKYFQCKERSEKYLAPDVLDYIRKKADVDNAKNELKVWERRKMLKELALSIAITDMKRIFRCTQTHPSWFK